MDGRIIHGISVVKGYSGIGGPYKEVGIVMGPGHESDKWEGLQGVDSFFPYKVGDKWYAIYGSANTEQLPIKRWANGMAFSKSINHGWKRMTDKNPQEFEPVFIENQVVTEIPGKGWISVYDNNVDNTFGWAYSADGINWKRGNPVAVTKGEQGWAKEMRTPLGLVHEGGNKYTVFYTAFKDVADWEGLFNNKPFNTHGAIGFVEVLLQ
ncbi:MAG: hypothetical protein HC867_00955 [Bacteroidia bacterium]|nr:hypothetical protein [Bacteroidia bacterium]